MNEDEFRRLAEQLLAAVARMDQRDEQLAQEVPALMEEQATRWLRTVSGQVETAARTGLEPPLVICQQRVQGLTAETDKLVSAMQGARRGLNSTLGWVIVGACVSLVFSFVASFGTYEMLYGHYRQQYDQLLTAVPYMDAVNRSDVVPCGDKQLCARIDDKAPRVGDKKQYRVVELRK